MSKFVTTNNKQNTSGTFYKTYQNIPQQRQFSSSFRQLDTNACIVESLTNEAQILFQKLSDRISQDQSKIKLNYQDLNQLSKDIEGHHLSASNDKEIEVIIKSQKEAIKELYNQDKNQIQIVNVKYRQELKTIAETLDFKQKQVDYEKEERDENWTKLIDSFEKEILQTQKELKKIRNKEEQVFEQTSLEIYNLQEQFELNIQEENQKRKQEHQTIIKLVSECIENMKYIY